MRPASIVAWLAAILHVAASAVYFLYLRPGLPPVPDVLRLVHMHAHPQAWAYSWYVWHAAGLSFVALCIVLAMRLRAPLGAIVAVAAVVFDLHSEELYIRALPYAADFVRLDHWLDIENAGIANFLYTAAMVLLVWSGRRVLPRAVILLTWPAAIGGVALTLFALMHVARGEFVAGGILFPFFVAWCIVIARWLQRSA